MSKKALTIGAAIMLWAVPLAAQQRGTVEFGAFGSAASFDEKLSLTTGYGGGGRVGVFLDPRWTMEFENAEMRASRPNGLNNVNVGILSGRLVAIPFRSGALSMLVGVGAGVGTETNFLHSYGYDALVGAKVALSENVAFRVDGVLDWLECHTCKAYYRSVRMGLSVYRRPSNTVRTIEVASAAATYVQRPDSVSADEQARRRRAAQDYRNLRDSLSMAPRMSMAASAPAPSPAPAPASASARNTMEEKIHFATDKSELSAEAKAILDAKVQVFRANPAMRINIVGNADQRASDAHNMALGSRRSSAAKAYLVSQGIEGNRIQISTDGERNPTASGTSKNAEAQNRRDEFRLLIASDNVTGSKQ